MPKPKSFKAVIEALEACIEAAPDDEKNALAQALYDYAKTYPESYRRLKTSGPAMAAVVEAIEDGSETFSGIGDE